MTKFELPEKPKKTNTSEDFNNLRKAVDELDKFDYAWKTYANKADRRINAANKHIEELERENQRLVAENLDLKTLVDSAKQQQPLPEVPEDVDKAIKYLKKHNNSTLSDLDDILTAKGFRWLNDFQFKDRRFGVGGLNNKLFILSHLAVTGYEVEKPQLFYLKNKITGNVLVYDESPELSEVSELFATGGEFELENYTFTQQEIDSMQTGSYEKIEVEE